jgi:peroxiredoxin
VRRQGGVLAALLILLCPWGSVASADPGLGRVEIGALAPDRALLGADGRSHRLSDYRGKTVILEWTSSVCPYTANKYRRGLMQALQRRAARQGAVWLSVNTSAPGKPGFLTPAQAKARIKATGSVVTEFLFDPGGAFARPYGIRTTPSMVMIDGQGRVVYQGAIDHVPEQTKPDGKDHISAALDDLKAERAIRTPETRAYGCAVEY